MHALLHSICAIVVLPYIALALLIVFIGQVFSSKGWLAALNTVMDNIIFYFGTAIYAVPFLWVGLVLMGFFPSLQRTGSLIVCIIAVISLIVIVGLATFQLDLDNLLFLAPCIVVAITCTYLVFRTKAL